jgi:hypothetical protein
VVLILINITCQFIKNMVQYSIDAKVEVEALRKSTHTIQYVDPEIEQVNAELMKQKEDQDKKIKDLEKSFGYKPAENDIFGY